MWTSGRPCRAALANYSPRIARQMRDFINERKAEGSITPGLECKQFCLRVGTD